MPIPTSFGATPNSSALRSALGGEILYVDWYPSPRQVEGSFLWLANYIDDMVAPLMQALAIAQNDTASRFHESSDPEGTPWPELDPDYLERKVNDGFPEDILIRTTDLYVAAPHGWKIIGNSLFYDTSGLPEVMTEEGPVKYGLIHQEGSGSPKNIGRAASFRAEVRAGKRTGGQRSKVPALYGKSEGERGQFIERGGALPARPWIGLSPEAIAEIEGIFEVWFSAGIDAIPWGEGPGAGEGIIYSPWPKQTMIPAFGGGYMERGGFPENRGWFSGVWGR